MLFRCDRWPFYNDYVPKTQVVHAFCSKHSNVPSVLYSSYSMGTDFWFLFFSGNRCGIDCNWGCCSEFLQPIFGFPWKWTSLCFNAFYHCWYYNIFCHILWLLWCIKGKLVYDPDCEYLGNYIVKNRGAH